jgi:phage/plasmid-like protein (TIGR03299 family)
MLLAERKDVTASSYMEALEQGGLNYQVGLAPLYALVNGQHKMLDDNYGVYRQDTGDLLHSVVGSRYSIIQQTDPTLAKIADSIIKPLGATYNSVGSLKQGNFFFVQAKLPEHWKIGNKDMINSMLTILGSHNGEKPLGIGFSNVRIVCQNTFVMALKDVTDYVSIRHTAQAEYQISQSEAILKQALDYFDQVKIKCAKYYETPFNDQQFNKALLQVFGKKEDEDCTRTKKQMDKVKDLFQSGQGIGIEALRGTAWSAYNAFTEYADHHKEVRGGDRLTSTMIGSAFNFKAKALQAIEANLVA